MRPMSRAPPPRPPHPRPRPPATYALRPAISEPCSWRGCSSRYRWSAPTAGWRCILSVWCIAYSRRKGSHPVSLNLGRRRRVRDQEPDFGTWDMRDAQRIACVRPPCVQTCYSGSNSQRQQWVVCRLWAALSRRLLSIAKQKPGSKGWVSAVGQHGTVVKADESVSSGQGHPGFAVDLAIASAGQDRDEPSANAEDVTAPSLTSLRAGVLVGGEHMLAISGADARRRQHASPGRTRHDFAAPISARERTVQRRLDAAAHKSRRTAARLTTRQRAHAVAIPVSYPVRRCRRLLSLRPSALRSRRQPAARISTVRPRSLRFRP